MKVTKNPIFSNYTYLKLSLFCKVLHISYWIPQKSERGSPLHLEVAAAKS
jgi:hypothetical protein